MNVDSLALTLLRDGVLSVVDRALSPLSEVEREETHKESWPTIMRRNQNAFKNTMAFMTTIERLRKTQEAMEGEVFLHEAVVMEAVNYLVWAEGPLQTSLKEVCFLAVRAGEEFKVMRCGKEVTRSSGKEVLETSLRQKLQFLRRVGVVVPRGIFDEKLRNAVAHMDFEVTDERGLHYDSKQTDLWRLQKKNWALRDVCIVILDALADGLRKYLPGQPFRPTSPPYEGLTGGLTGESYEADGGDCGK